MKPAPSPYSFGPFEFDPSQRELRNAGERVSLPSTLNKLLAQLVSRPGQLVTRKEIADALWDDQGTVDVENGINGAVRRLRSQLSTERDAGDLYIETVVGMGYRFVAPVGEVPESRSDVETPSVESAGDIEEGPSEFIERRAAPAAMRAPTWRWVAFLTFVLIGFGCVGYGGVLWYERRAAKAAFSGATALSFDWSPLTHRGPEDEVTTQAISPSGKYVAVVDRLGVSVQEVQGGAPLALMVPEGLRTEDVSWFPDERTILVSGVRSTGSSSGGPSEAWVVKVGGEAPQHLLGDAALAKVSPDGSRVAYVRGGRAELWVADADGQKTRRLAGEKAGETIDCLIWSPGGDRLVVNRRTEARNETDAEKGALDQLQHQTGWVYESYDATGGKLLARQEGLRFDSALLLGDGRLFYPVLNQGEDARLDMVRTDGASGRILAGPESLSAAGWGIRAASVKDLNGSRSGGGFSAVVERSSADVFVGDLRYGASGTMPAMTRVRRLAMHADSTYPTAWSPKGDTLVFDHGEAGRWVIAREQPDGGAMEVVADTGGRAVQGQFTPDGKWILFLHYVGKPSRVQSIDRVAAGGGASQVVYASGNIQDFNCSRSGGGQCVLRETVGNQELVFYAVTAEGGRGKELARTAWMPNVLGDWSLSADGTTVAMANHDPRHPGFVLLELGGKASQAIAVKGFGTVLCPTWDVSGKGFFVETNSAEGYALVYVDLQGNGSLFLKSPDPIWGVQSRDGKRLAFPGRTPLTRNVWVGRMP